MTQTVLVVDDSSFITEGLTSLLKKNYRTIISSGGEMCLEILKKETPDIIILDILMEPMDGWETLLRIRENPATRYIPVIMFSAKKISPFEAETHHPYIDDYITKPVSPRNLLDTIAKVLSRKEAGRRTIERWKLAGLQTEEIEEYVRLMTSIEVDRGLCSNMQQQLSTERKDTPLEEIRRTIEVISSRIRENVILAEEIARKGDSLIAAGAETGATPCPASPDGSGEMPWQDTGPSSPVTPLRAANLTEPGILPEDPPASSPIPVSESGWIDGRSGNEFAAPAIIYGEGQENGTNQNMAYTGISVTPSGNPVHKNAEQDATDDITKFPIHDSGLMAFSGTEETAAPDKLPITTISESLLEEEQDSNPALTTESISPVQFPVITPGENGRQTVYEEIAIGENEQPHQVQEATAHNQQPLVQLSSREGAETNGRPHQTAQATEIADNSRSMEMPETQNRQDNVKITSPVKATQGPGIFARIIAAIARLFSRSKP